MTLQEAHTPCYVFLEIFSYLLPGIDKIVCCIGVFSLGHLTVLKVLTCWNHYNTILACWTGSIGVILHSKRTA